MNKQIEIPQEIYSSDKACAEFIVRINEQLSKVAAWEKMLKEAKDTASMHLLARMDAEGAKHFAFDGVGTFARRTSDKCNFPSDEDGGREAAGMWIDQLLAQGIIATHHVLYLQQKRVVTESVVEVEKLACEHNWTVLLNAALTTPAAIVEEKKKLEDGLVTYDELLNRQQAFRETLDRMNATAATQYHLVAASPFSHYRETQLSAPRKSK